MLPAYNEEASLPNLLPKIKQQLAGHEGGYHVVVINDGSNDNTSSELDSYAKEMPLTVITHEINRGLGESERDGFEYIALNAARDDIMVRMDCDDTHEPRYIPAIIEKMHEGNDVVITSRFQQGGGQKGVDGYRAFISSGASLFMKVMFNIPNVRDYSCGYRGYRVSLIQDAVRTFGNNFIQLRGLGFTSTLETIVKLHILGARFAEVPFMLRYDQKLSASKMSSAITVLGYFTLALLYHYPIRGWKARYRGLRELYPQDSQRAVKEYNRKSLPPETEKRLRF